MRKEHFFVEKYMQMVKNCLPCGRDGKKAMQTLERMIQAFLAEEPDAAYADLEQALGSPEYMARTLAEQDDYRQTEKAYQRVIFILSILLVLAAGLAVYAHGHPRCIVEEDPIVRETVLQEENWDYVAKYGLGYICDDENRIVSAVDYQGNKVRVDRKGIPLDEQIYYITEEDKERIRNRELEFGNEK